MGRSGARIGGLAPRTFCTSCSPPGWPELLETPALLKRITSRFLARPSDTVPIIHSPAEMLVEDERHAAGLAETAIGETDSVGLDELRRSGLVIVLDH
jgi:hypothetical protein